MAGQATCSGVRPRRCCSACPRAAGWTLLAAVVDPEPGQRLGVDVEDPARTDFEGFDAVVLTPAERLDLAGLAGGSLLQARARLWARKEAWLKMTGTGLLTAPDTVDVREGGMGTPGPGSGTCRRRNPACLRTSWPPARCVSNTLC